MPGGTGSSPGSPTPPPRDRQRSAVYAAENQVGRILDRAAGFPIAEVAGSRIRVPAELRFGEIAAVQRYVDAVLDLPWVHSRWPDRALCPVTVRERRGNSRAHYEIAAAVIAVPAATHGPSWALREMVVLHEIAHHLGGAADTGHGPGFAGRLLALVEGVIGTEAALLLRVALADQGVTAG